MKSVACDRLGFSLIEIMIGLGLVSVFASNLGQLMVSMNQAPLSMMVKSDIQSLFFGVQQMFAQSQSCTSALTAFQNKTTGDIVVAMAGDPPVVYAKGGMSFNKWKIESLKATLVEDYGTSALINIKINTTTDDSVTGNQNPSYSLNTMVNKNSNGEITGCLSNQQSEFIEPVYAFGGQQHTNWVLEKYTKGTIFVDSFATTVDISSLVPKEAKFAIFKTHCNNMNGVYLLPNSDTQTTPKTSSQWSQFFQKNVDSLSCIDESNGTSTGFITVPLADNKKIKLVMKGKSDGDPAWWYLGFLVGWK